MNLVVQDEFLQGMNISEAEARLDFALGLYVDRRVTLERAARIAECSQFVFLKELEQRDISVHYDLDDLSSDIETLASLER